METAGDTLHRPWLFEELSFREISRHPGLVAAIGHLIDDGHIRADEGANATLHTEVGENGRLVFDETDNLFRTLSHTGPATRAFGNNDVGYHRLLLLFRYLLFVNRY